MEDQIFPDKRESHITLLPSRRLSRHPTAWFSSSGSPPQRFNIRRQDNSFFLAAFLQPLLQTIARSDSFSDRQL